MYSLINYSYQNHCLVVEVARFEAFLNKTIYCVLNKKKNSKKSTVNPCI